MRRKAVSKKAKTAGADKAGGKTARVKKAAAFSLTRLLDKKHRPAHGLVAGLILILLKDIAALFAVIGIGLIILSSLAYLQKQPTKSR